MPKKDKDGLGVRPVPGRTALVLMVGTAPCPCAQRSGPHGKVITTAADQLSLLTYSTKLYSRQCGHVEGQGKLMLQLLELKMKEMAFVARQ